MLATGLNPIAINSPEGEEEKLDLSKAVVQTTKGEATASHSCLVGRQLAFWWPVCCQSVLALVELYEEWGPSWSLVLA